MNKTAFQYHTNTGYKRNNLGGYQLDWQNQPLLYKKYKGLKNIPLPVTQTPPGVPVKSIRQIKVTPPYSKTIDIKKVSTILHLTYSITARAKYSNGFYYYRSAASAGALYPVEVYLMIRNVDSLEDGFYHFNIMNHSLTRLRKGDYSIYTGSMTLPKSKSRPIISFIFSSIFFRSSWKYRDRAYRYHLLDTGHVLENLILALNFLSIPFNLFYNFNDAEINKLIGIDEFREAAFIIINVPGTEKIKDDIQPPIDELPGEISNASLVSVNDIDYPSIREIHGAGRIPTHKEIPEGNISHDDLPSPEIWMDVETANKPENSIPYPECLFKRRSKRNFIDRKIAQNDIMAFLDIISGNSKISHRHPSDHKLLNISFFAEKIDGVPPGLYTLDRAQRKFGIIREGIFGEKIAHTCLDQEWLKNAGLHFLFTCNIEELDKKYSPRGYRYAMIKAGKIGQLLYITATSLGLGCCGIGAFYDEEAMDLIDLKGGTRLLYLVAIGNIKKQK